MALKLQAENLKKTYGDRTVVNGVSLNVEQGEVVGLLGPNGAGKTTSFYMIVGLVKAEDGRILLGEQDVTLFPIHQRALEGIGYLPQEMSVFRDLTVEENILAVLEMRPLDHPKRLARLEALLDDFGLQHVRQSLGRDLSGGERRRVEIARALALGPKFILLDEPFAGVDPLAVNDIQKIIIDLKQRGIGVLITDHNVRETLRIVDRAYIIGRGSLLAQGTPDEIIADPQARECYLGQEFKM